jgi:hypothetical protein
VQVRSVASYEQSLADAERQLAVYLRSRDRLLALPPNNNLISSGICLAELAIARTRDMIAYYAMRLARARTREAEQNPDDH